MSASVGAARRAHAFAATGGVFCLFVTVVAAAFLAAPTGNTAANERVVNFYNWSDYIDPTVLADFTKATGIKVRYDTFDSNDTLEAKLLAGNSGYDVVVPTAYFLSHQITAGVFQKLDKAKLPNLVNIWPEIATRLAAYDPGNAYAVNYMWGTTGIGYDVKAAAAIFARNGASAAAAGARTDAAGGASASIDPSVDSSIDAWDDVFVPAKIARFKDCGIELLDSSDDIISAALHYLHLDPNSSDPGDLIRAADVITKIRPYVRKFHSSDYLNALATGEICFVVGFSGDIKQAQKRAAQAKRGIEIGYAIPKEGAQLWFDNLAIPRDAPHAAEANELVNFLLQPEVAAKNTNFISYANGNLASQKFVDKTILDDRTVYPDAATMARLYTITAHDPKIQRLINRLWTRIKTGN